VHASDDGINLKVHGGHSVDDEKAADAEIHAERADIGGNAKIAGGAVDIAIDFDEVDLAVDGAECIMYSVSSNCHKP
jgi:hypothetical protein